MTIFDERERDFEARYKHDQELQFKVKARRNRLLGMWAAERMGLSDEPAQAYAKSVVEAAFHGGDHNIIEKVCADLNAKGQGSTLGQVQTQLNHFAESAKQQVMQE